MNLKNKGEVAVVDYLQWMIRELAADEYRKGAPAAINTSVPVTETLDLYYQLSGKRRFSSEECAALEAHVAGLRRNECQVEIMKLDAVRARAKAEEVE